MIPKWPNFILIALECIAFFSCARVPETSSKIHYLGQITKVRVERLKLELNDGDTVRVSSYGGNVLAALEAADLFEKYSVRVEIGSHCISACAEILLAANVVIHMKENTLIGFHGNPFLYNHFYTEYDPKRRSSCHTHAMGRIETLYALSGYNTQFWREQEKRLLPRNISFEDDGSACGIVHYQLRRNIARKFYWQLMS